MDIERIDKTHLKITLCKADMQELNIDYKMFSYNDQASRAIIRSMLAKANRLTGFAYTRCRLLIEVFPHADSGCTLLFTRLKAKYRSGRLRLTNVQNPVFCFSSADALMTCAEKIKDFGDYRFSSHLYFLNGKYYLSILNKVGYYGKIKDAFSEFADRRCPQIDVFYRERAQLICENDALSMLRNAFCKSK